MVNKLKSLRKSCPVCNKTIVIDIEFEGKNMKFGIFCPHCYKEDIKTLIKVEIKNETKISLYKI